MVITQADIKNLPPAERVKALRKLQSEKQEELRRLQEEKSREIKEAQSKLEESLEELELEEEQAQEAVFKRDQSSSEQPLEETVVAEQPKEVTGNVMYGGSLERLMPGNLQDLSDYNLYNELRDLEGKNYLTPDEQRRIAQLRDTTSAITAAYSRQDINRVDERRGNYLSRTEQVLQRLQDKMHDLQHGLYHLNERDPDAIYQR